MPPAKGRRVPDPKTEALARSKLAVRGTVTRPCTHPQHDPPMHMVFPVGTHTHTCPGCGISRDFRVNGITC